MSFDINDIRIGVIGLGYVGLPSASAMLDCRWQSNSVTNIRPSAST